MSFICKSYPTRRVCNAELALFIVRSRGLHTLQRGQRVGAPGHAASLFHDVWRQELTLHGAIRQRISNLNLAERPEIIMEIIDALDAVPPGDRRRARRAPSPRGKDQASKVRAKVLEFRGEDRQPRRRDGESCVEVVCTRYGMRGASSLAGSGLTSPERSPHTSVASHTADHFPGPHMTCVRSVT